MKFTYDMVYSSISDDDLAWFLYFLCKDDNIDLENDNYTDFINQLPEFIKKKYKSRLSDVVFEMLKDGEAVIENDKIKFKATIEKYPKMKELAKEAEKILNKK